MSYGSTTGVDESSLRLWRHDGTWTQLPAPNGVDTVDDYVYANVTSFPGPPAEYGALGDDATAPPATPTTPTPTPTATPVQTVDPTPATPTTPAPVPVDDCVDIDEPGVYELQGDLLDRPEDVCIDIQVGGVTFDGNGHTIDSDGSSSITGVRAGDFSGASSADVVVRDVEVRDWYRGVWFHAVDGGAIRDVTSTNQTIGVTVEDGAAIAVTDVTGTDSGGPHPRGVLRVARRHRQRVRSRR